MSSNPPPSSYAPVRASSPDTIVTTSQTYSSLSSAALPDNFVSPEMVESDTLLGNHNYPAPSILSRNSTIPDTPPLGGDQRQSWSSNLALAATAGSFAGAEGRPAVLRGQSNLIHSSLGWNNTSSERPSSPSSEDDEEQGHIPPAALTGAGAGAAALGAAELSEKKPRWAPKGPARGYDLPASAGKRNRKWLWIGIGTGLVLVIGVAVGLGVGLSTRKSATPVSSGSTNANAGSSGSSAASGTATASTSAPSSTPTTGKQGSLIAMQDGTPFVYNNPFGGSWVWDAANPFNNEAQANSWTPKLSQNWTWGVDQVRGVNLGGWLNTEPFIVPALYEKYANVGGQQAVDEYTLSQNMGSNLTAELTNHYETFITEQDIAEIAAAGLNWVRIPLAHWAIETWPGEPYLERVSWTYFLKAIQWCRKYGIRINLDFHTMPGSQNGWNHSGHLGSINWLNGVMGTANAQRSLDYIRTLAEFIAQPEYRNVIQMFGFVNEPNANGIGQAPVGSFYYEAYNIIRSITGIGAGNGPMLSIHDGFLGINAWYSFLPGADRVALDQHPYMIFGNQPTGSLDTLAKNPCTYWAVATNTTSQTFGVNVAGEWSAASNDCGYWINNVGQGARYDGSYAGFTAVGSCALWNDYTLWNATTIKFVHDFAAASMDALQNYFFWTWKIGNSTAAIKQPNPAWHYKLGLEKGWIPSDPRVAVGWCANLGVSGSEFSGTFSSAYMTGGPGAGQIPASMSSSYPWPAKSYTNVPAASMSLLPQYTQTGTPISMPALTYTAPGSSSTINAGNGWVGGGNNRQAYAAISGCSYPSEYSAASLAIPTTACGAGLNQPTKRFPSPTAAPTL